MILFPKWTEVNEDIKKAPPIEGGSFEVYPPSQKAMDFKAVDECEGGKPSKLVTSVVGYASEGSAL